MKGLLMGVANETIIVTSMAPVLMNAFFKWFMAYDVFVLAITYVKLFIFYTELLIAVDVETCVIILDV